MNRIHSDDEPMNARSQVCVERTCGWWWYRPESACQQHEQRHSKIPFILFIHYSFDDFSQLFVQRHLIVQWIKYLDKYIVYV